MHVDTGKSGSVLSILVPTVLLALFLGAAGCASDREQRPAPAPAPPAATEEPAPQAVPGEAEGEETKEWPEGWGTPEEEPAAGEIPAEPEEQVQPEGLGTPEEAPPTPGEQPAAQEAQPALQAETPAQEEPAPEAQPEETAPTSETSETTWEKEEVEEGPLPSWMHGSIDVRYRGRTGSGDRDHDLRGVLALDLGDPRVHGLTGHVLARVDVDLEGLDGGEVFEDLADTYDQSVVSKLYLAYADVALDSGPEDAPTLRVGRQSDPLLPEVLYLDGVSYLSRPMGKKEVEFGLYGGIPVHFYESSSEGDRAFGTFVEGRPWDGGRARFDWMHLEDEEVLGEGEDDLLALGLWQEVAKHWRFEGEYTHLEGDPRDLRLRGFYTDLDSETIVRAGYYELLEPQAALVTELDPFFEQLLEYEPFRQTNLVVSQAFGIHTVVDAGIDLRRVSDSGDVGEFNRDWERYYTTVSLDDVSAKGLGLSFTVDRWDDDERDISSLGADLSYDSDDRWDGAIGTYYSLYKYEFLELDEREDVRTYYVRASREVSERLDLEFVYEFENDDLDTYHTLRLGALWQF